MAFSDLLNSVSVARAATIQIRHDLIEKLERLKQVEALIAFALA